MAKGEPLYAKQYLVTELILNNDSPQLRSKTWSPYFVSFLDYCLKKDPSERWSAKELLQHPFITGLPSKKTIRVEIKEHLRALHNWPAKKGLRQAAHWALKHLRRACDICAETSTEGEEVQLMALEGFSCY
eukprot:XP_017952841.1 PREDICTED: mitogen-activated protein kinase kinase kinase kinase 4-like [Xenopus tropicalis]